jgi:hypothetical protein
MSTATITAPMSPAMSSCVAPALAGDAGGWRCGRVCCSTAAWWPGCAPGAPSLPPRPGRSSKRSPRLPWLSSRGGEPV